MLFDESEYKMWFVGINSEGKARIGLATSSDGTNWNPVVGFSGEGSVLEFGTPSTSHVQSPSVIKDTTGGYKMWYVRDLNGTSYYYYAANANGDGINWSISSEPILSHNRVEALPFEVSNGKNASCFVMEDPDVDGYNYKMWYSALSEFSNNKTSRIGLARSIDGLIWDRVDGGGDGYVLGPGEPGKFDSSGVFSPLVVKDKGIYRMWYCGSDNSTFMNGIGYAWSKDGINWVKEYDGDVGGAIQDLYTADATFPYILKDGNVYKIWYGYHDTVFDEYVIGCGISNWEPYQSLP